MQIWSIKLDTENATQQSIWFDIDEPALDPAPQEIGMLINIEQKEIVYN